MERKKKLRLLLFLQETEFTVSPEVEILVSEDATNPRLPSPVVVMPGNILHAVINK